MVDRQQTIIGDYEVKKSCCKKTFIITSYILDKIGFRFTFFVPSIIFVVLGFVFANSTEKFYEYSLGSLFMLIGLFFGALFIAGLVNFIVFGIIDLIFYFNIFISFYYYLTSFNQIVGMITSLTLFVIYYPQLSGFPFNEIINKIIYCLIILVSTIGIHSLLIKIIMFRRVNELFNNKLKNILLNIEMFKRISSKDKMEQKEITINITPWTILKIKHNGIIDGNIFGKHTIYNEDDLKNYMNSIWHNIVSKMASSSKHRIFAKDIMEWMGINENDDYYEQAKNLIDLNNDTYVRKEEFVNAFISMFNEWKNFDRSYYDHTSISNVIGIVLGIILGFFLLYIFLAIFGVSSDTVFTPLFTIVVSLSFAIGSIISKIVSSLIFVGYIYAYDIEDKIKIVNPFSSNTLIVKKINILTTVFKEACSGKHIIIPNYELMNYTLENHQRSYDVTMVIDLELDYLIKDEVLDYVKDEFDDYIKSMPESWKPYTELYIKNSNISEGYMNVAIWLHHQSCWMQGGTIWNSYTKALKKLLNILDKYGITYQKPIQPVKVKES